MIIVRKVGLYNRFFLIGAFLVFSSLKADAQFLMDMIDTTKEIGRGMFSMFKKYDHVRISGYIQPQYQVASEEGIASYSGGDFSAFSNNRFLLRRGRIRFDYALLDEDEFPRLQFVFQFDGTERGVNIRDFWGRFWENRYHAFSVTTGMFARPFGYEINLSSSDREAPERGRMSQILMKTERDLGVMASFEPRKTTRFFKYVRVDLGVFNGQGLAGPNEFDSYKDVITQLVIKPVPLYKNLLLGGGISVLHGGIRQFSPYTYRLNQNGGNKIYISDSVSTLPGAKLPRRYYGINGQLKWNHGWGSTEVRAEYWSGTQTSGKVNTETPGTLGSQPPGTFTPLYIRDFNGGFFLFLQNIVNKKHQIGVKLDYYDPNVDVSGMEIGSPGNELTAGDIKYTTLGFGYINYINENFKLVLWYDSVRNEETELAGFKSDISDNVFTARIQYRF